MFKSLRTFCLCSFFISILFFLGGCSTAGPFVTNISSDGQGNLIVEKNTVRFNSFTGTVSSGENPTTTKLQMIPEDMIKKLENLDRYTSD
ncbi:MAG: hypothetical protein K9K62_06940 [Desulfobacteraceae bacterium]|nr:hypothetical protein [Desulfobacteraceae bacterium]